MENETQERCERANLLIKKISEVGRMFFRNECKKNIASFSILKNGKLFYEDEYREERDAITPGMEWNELDWVNHGSGLKGFIIYLASYIFTGEKLCSVGRYWGYNKEELKQVHDYGFEIGIFKTKDFAYYCYETHKEVSSIQELNNGKDGIPPSPNLPTII